MQPFTSDKAALLAAISAPFDKGRNTRLYDAVFQAVDDTAMNANYRRAVIVATDGKDEGPTPGVPIPIAAWMKLLTMQKAKRFRYSR